MITYKEDPSAEECAAHIVAGGKVERWNEPGRWEQSALTLAEGFHGCIANGFRYRLVLEAPPGAPPMSVPSPWTPGAVLGIAGDMPEGWVGRWWVDGGWYPASSFPPEAFVEARPPDPPEPATEDVEPHRSFGRRLPGMDDPIDALHQFSTGWTYEFRNHGPFSLPINPDGTVTVLADDEDGER